MDPEAKAFLDIALARLDLLLHREILRLRAAYQLSLDEFRGLYVSDEQVDRLVDTRLAVTPDSEVVALTRRAEQLRTEMAAVLDAAHPWVRLSEEFALSGFEQDVLLLGIAPEIDLKYETLYAYLNNDVGRKWPTHDLALRVFASDRTERASLRGSLLPESTLYANGLLRPLEPSGPHQSSLAVGFAASPLPVRFVLGMPLDEARHARFISRSHAGRAADTDRLAPEQRERVAGLARLCSGASAAPVFLFQGRTGMGRAAAAELLCHSVGRPLLRVDLEAVRAAADALPDVFGALALVARLERAGVWAAPLEALLDASGQRLPVARTILEALTRLAGPVILGCGPGAAWRALLGETRCVRVAFADPSRAERERLWQLSLEHRGLSLPAAPRKKLADHFTLGAPQIRRAVDAVADARDLDSAAASDLTDALFGAARDESGQELGALAVKVALPHGWDDLVLPASTLQRLKEVAAAIRHRHRVFEQWGFARRIATGRGLKVLFAGTTGTGKTMSAGVIARDIGVDLYKIDLAGIVSKYIGETEKNLDRIFRAAASSNAILFFDEADALFGKRSEVKDAHDRYANIEISYLLQKMEEHEGAVILATNLRRNIDDAFGRRMHYVIEFPMPDAKQRERLWRGMFPPTVPLARDVDYGFLARQFELAGGDIQNVALDAAFLAAQDGQVVDMRHLVNAVGRQLLKQGKIPSAQDFRQYHPLLAGSA